MRFKSLFFFSCVFCFFLLGPGTDDDDDEYNGVWNRDDGDNGGKNVGDDGDNAGDNWSDEDMSSRLTTLKSLSEVDDEDDDEKEIPYRRLLKIMDKGCETGGRWGWGWGKCCLW